MDTPEEHPNRNPADPEPIPGITPMGLRHNIIRLGGTDKELHRRRRSNTVDRLYWGVYAEPRISAVTESGRTVGPDSAVAHRERYRQRVIAATLVGERRKVASHESAAAVHGLKTVRLPDDIHFTAHRAGGGRRSGRAFHLHASPLPDDEVTIVDGVLVTTLARTALDIGRRASFADALVVLDSALRLGATHEEIGILVARAHRRHGISTVRTALRFADGNSESVGESLFRAALISSGDVPLPELQVEFFDARGVFVARADFSWGGRVVVEFDGLDKYRTRDDLIAEKRREDALRALGVIVLRFTWADLTNPHRIRERVLAALREAGLLAA